MRNGCAFELILALAVLVMLIFALPYSVRQNARSHPGTLDPILNHQGVSR